MLEWRGMCFPKGMEESLQFVFLCIFSLVLRPWVERERRRSVNGGGLRGTPTFLEAPGQKLACGVPTFLSCWGRQVERLVGRRGTSVAAGAAAPESPPRHCVCVSALCVRRTAAVQQSSRLEESLCEGGPRRSLWICSGPFLGSDRDTVRKFRYKTGNNTHSWHSHEIRNFYWARLTKSGRDRNWQFSQLTSE